MVDLRKSRSWRLIAVAALVALALAAFLGVWLIIRNPLLAITFGLTCAGLAAVVWRGLFRQRPGSTWPYVVAVAFLFAALLYETAFFFRDQRNARLVLALLVLSGFGICLGAVLRWRYFRKHDRARLPAGAKPFLIINPKSGGGRAIKQRIPQLAANQGIRVLVLEPGGSLTKLIERAVDEGATVLGMSGGDGSLGVAAAATLRHNLPLVVLPGGTRCHFARDIGLDPENMADALRAFGGPVVSIDAAEINGRVFLNNASFGIYADIVQQPGYREHKMQKTMEVLNSQTAVEGYHLNFADGAGSTHDHAVMVLVGVNRYETLNVTELGSRRRLDEGVLQVTAVYRLEQSLIKQLSGTMTLAQSTSPADMGQWVTQEFKIAGDGDSVEAGVDGEVVKLGSPVRLRVLPRQLRLMVPPEGIQHRRTARSMLTNLRDYALRGKLPHE